MQPVCMEECEELAINSYEAFLEVISPYNIDFKRMMLDRQLDHDLCAQ